MELPAVSLQIYVDPASEPITGSVVYPDGREVAFAGWIELAAALEEARRYEAVDVVAHLKRTPADAGSESPGDNRDDSAEPDDEPA